MKVSDEDFRTICEAGRLSPSSFGLEPWHVLVVENDELTEELLKTCWGMKRGASRTVIILARRRMGAFTPHVSRILNHVQKLDEQAKGSAGSTSPGSSRRTST